MGIGVQCWTWLFTSRCLLEKVELGRLAAARQNSNGRGLTPPKIVNEVTAVVEYDHEHIFVGPIMRLFGGSLGTVRLRAISTMRLE